MTFHLEAAALCTTTSHYLCVVLKVKFASDREILEIIPPSDVCSERLSYRAFILSEEIKCEFPQCEDESVHVASIYWII